MSKIPPRIEIEIQDDAPALAEYAATHFIQTAEDGIGKHGRFSVCLAGGSTPRLLYSILAQPDRAAQMDWTRVQVFWGDERCVPPDHPDSNFLMAQQALLDHVPLPAANVHRILGELDPDHAALEYADVLRAVFPGQEVPRFDLVLLGLGDDGHTASLFPGSSALSETKRWVVCVEHQSPPPPLITRISLTLPVINHAANVFFLVSGAGKSAILSRVMQNEAASNRLPAQLVHPSDGRLVWMVDRMAAGENLTNEIKKVE